MSERPANIFQRAKIFWGEGGNFLIYGTGTNDGAENNKQN